MKTFNPLRLSLARKRRGLTKRDLENLTRISTRSFSSYEAGTQIPTEDSLKQISIALDFPEEFFYGDDLEEIDLEAVSFRRLTKVSHKKQNQVVAIGAFALSLTKWVEENYELPAVNIPTLEGATPEEAARAVRSEWGLGDAPISNMVHLLEAFGVKVFSLPQEHSEIDAYSMWRDDRPYVFLNTLKSAERGRMDAAHELGHLVLHWHLDKPRGRELELEADRFAAEFLIPESSVFGNIPRDPSLENLIVLKKIWNVSVANLTYRLHTLNMLTEWEYRNMFIQISKNNYRKSEPNSCDRERTQLWLKVSHLLREDGLSFVDIAKATSVPIQEMKDLLFDIVLTAHDGQDDGMDSFTQQVSVKPHLRLINSSDSDHHDELRTVEKR